MHNKLLEILQVKQFEVEQLKQTAPELMQLEFNNTGLKSFRQALRGDQLAFITEIKRRSPSKGLLSSLTSPLPLLKEYLAGGASAISVLTDQQFFGGSIADLTQVVQELKNSAVPVLRKDFIIDFIQINQARYVGANCVLLIVAVLGKRVADFIDHANALGMDALVEVHNHDELLLAIDSGATIIGINNRDLTSFSEDLSVSIELIKHIPPAITTVAESAIRTVDDIRLIAQAGFNAALIGEALVTAPNPSTTLRQWVKVL